MKFNTVAWFEFGSDQPQKVKDFYKEMFGWEYKQNTDLEGVEYDGILTPAAPVPTGGILGTAGKIEEYATFYVLVEDVPAAIEKAKENGGEVIWGPVTDASNVSFARLKDNTGHQFSVFSAPGIGEY